MKKTINNIKFKMIFNEKYPENIIDNTIAFLEIAKKYDVKTIGIGYWMHSFKESFGFISAFYKECLKTNDKFFKIKNNCFCDDCFKKSQKIDNIYVWKDYPKIWIICQEFDKVHNTTHSQCGNSGQYQFNTIDLINGIWNYSNNNWHLLNED